MKKIIIVFIVGLFLLSGCVRENFSAATIPAKEEDQSLKATVAPGDFSNIARPFPQHTHYAPGSILPNQRTQDELDQDVRDFYTYWKANYIVESGTNDAGFPLYRVAFGKDGENHQSTVSEGQGFGMIILPVMAGEDPKAQEIFNGLWLFTRSHPSEVDNRLMDWKVPETESGNDSAFDGDADMALGLLMADAQWGSQGTINYKEEAKTLIPAIRESTIGPQSNLPMLGDWTDADGAVYNQFTPRSSDFMLVNFRAFAAATQDSTWDLVVKSSQNVMTSLQSTVSKETGLIPDFIELAGKDHVVQPAAADFLEGENDGAFSYNAGRDPWRVGADALLYGDTISKEIALKISHWAEVSTQGDPLAFHAGYQLDGTPLAGSDYFTTFFVAPLGVAAMSDPSQQDWLNKIYAAVYKTHEDYYEDSVTLLCLITMSGNAWVP